MWKAASFNAVTYLAVGLVFLFFSQPIVGIFTHEPEVLTYGSSALHIIAFGFAFYGLGMVLETAFNGAGDTWTPTYLNLLIFWIFEIPLAYLLALAILWYSFQRSSAPAQPKQTSYSEFLSEVRTGHVAAELVGN